MLRLFAVVVAFLFLFPSPVFAQSVPCYWGQIYRNDFQDSYYSTGGRTDDTQCGWNADKTRGPLCTNEWYDTGDTVPSSWSFTAGYDVVTHQNLIDRTCPAGWNYRSSSSSMWSCSKRIGGGDPTAVYGEPREYIKGHVVTVHGSDVSITISSKAPTYEKSLWMSKGICPAGEWVDGGPIGEPPPPPPPDKSSLSFSCNLVIPEPYVPKFRVGKRIDINIIGNYSIPSSSTLTLSLGGVSMPFNLGGLVNLKWFAYSLLAYRIVTWEDEK